MSKRHSDAIAISQGAINISGMAHSLVSACKECIETDKTMKMDPAVRLIVSQIAYIAGIWNGANEWARGSFSEDLRACELAIAAEKPEKEELSCYSSDERRDANGKTL